MTVPAPSKLPFVVLLGAALVLPWSAAPATAAGEGAGAETETAPAADTAAETAPDDRRARQIEAARRYFTDVELVNQYGEPMRLYSDLLQGKVVVINTIFTDCTGICPLMSKSLERIQERLGERLGEDVHFLSITVDPESDSPEAMRQFAETFDARRGWYFLTGEPEKVAFALRKLGQYVEDPETHQGIMIMGNDRTGLWKKAFGLASYEKLENVFDSVLNDAGAAGPEAGG